MELRKEQFVNLHGHSCFSLFDGFGFPQEHMDFAYENGSKALALTDHGSMNGLSYQLLRAKEMKAQGKDFKPIFGVEAYYIDSLTDWQNLRNEIAQDKKRSKEIEKGDSAMVVEDEQRNDKRALGRKRHLLLRIRKVLRTSMRWCPSLILVTTSIASLVLTGRCSRSTPRASLYSQPVLAALPLVLCGRSKKRARMRLSRTCYQI